MLVIYLKANKLANSAVMAIFGTPIIAIITSPSTGRRNAFLHVSELPSYRKILSRG